jgi:ferredoxin
LSSQFVDAEGIEAATGLQCSKVHSSLCTKEIRIAAKAIEHGDAIIACQQERQRFIELADEIGASEPDFLDLRDRAGWSDDATSKMPKMAALAAEALLPAAPFKSLDVHSNGLCLIIGPTEVAKSAALDLCEILSVTILSDVPADVMIDSRFDQIFGSLKSARGALGGFEVRLENLQEIVRGGRGASELTPSKDGATSQCDVILDLSGDAPLFPAPEKREGYLRADPKSPGLVAEAVLKASQLVGIFEKPLYVKLEEPLCAHSRAEQIACSKCLNICPTGAIVPNGDHVAIDPMICAGCGGCAAVCPSGAITYDAPAVDIIFKRQQTLASTYRKAGGKAPRLLVTDREFGTEMISLFARFGRGLPAEVIPMEVDALGGYGHAEILAALACGFASVDILLAPKTDREALDQEIVIAQALGGGSTIRLLDLKDPDALADQLHQKNKSTSECEPILPIGNRRQVARLAATALNARDDIVSLPDTAPYGTVVVDTDSCTLCLSCVSLCPSGALADNPDLPQLRFQEDACLQCGLCKNICPEQAITLEPRLDLTTKALEQRVLHEEEPCACIECSALFGVKSTVDKILEKLAGKHAMFADSDMARMIQMCDNCRVKAQFHAESSPFAGKERPRVRVTDDYFSKRKDH